MDSPDKQPAFDQPHNCTLGSLTMRDWFAGQALSVVPVRSWDFIENDDDKMKAWVRLSYELDVLAPMLKAEVQRGDYRTAYKTLPGIRDRVNALLENLEAYLDDMETPNPK